jgi:catechol 2,3-dioxygenase-like lactoylglutathione lyase family enzyme
MSEETSMPVQRVDFVGIRTDRLNETVALFRDVLSIPVTRKTDGLVGFRLADGTTLELYGPSEDFHTFSRPDRSSPFASMIFRLCDAR